MCDQDFSMVGRWEWIEFTVADGELQVGGRSEAACRYLYSWGVAVGRDEARTPVPTVLTRTRGKEWHSPWRDQQGS
jgi:ribosomal protein S11